VYEKNASAPSTGTITRLILAMLFALLGKNCAIYHIPGPVDLQKLDFAYPHIFCLETRKCRSRLIQIALSKTVKDFTKTFIFRKLHSKKI